MERSQHARLLQRDVSSFLFGAHSILALPLAGSVYHHFDLYRLPDVSGAFARLELEQAFQTGVCIVEWAERLADRAPPDAIDISISQVEGDHNARQFDISFPLSRNASTWNTTVDLLLKHGQGAGLEAIAC